MSSGRSHYRIQIRKEALKFSAAHMTVFADGTKERIHGHNYRTQVSMKFREFDLDRMLPFSEVKRVMKAICAEWDERFFLPSLCPHLERLESTAGEAEFRLCGLRYVLPAEEVVELAVDNITTESLAAEFAHRLVAGITRERLKNHGVFELEVQVEEMTGQGAAFTLDFSEALTEAFTEALTETSPEGVAKQP